MQDLVAARHDPGRLQALAWNMIHFRFGDLVHRPIRHAVIAASDNSSTWKSHCKRAREC